MTYYVYVSQGRCGRISKQDITPAAGLVTDGFSSCNILAMVSANKMTLVHVDIQTTPDNLKQAYAWHAGDGDVKVLIARRNLEIARHAEDLIRRGAKLPVSAVIPIDEFDGDKICLSFDAFPEGGKSLEANLHLYPRGMSLERLVQHPQEPEMTDYLKTHALFAPTQQHTQTFVIFDQGFWQPLRSPIDLAWGDAVKKYLAPTSTHPRGFLVSSETFILTTSKTMGVIDQLTKEGIGLARGGVDGVKQEAFGIAPHIYGLLNDYDYKATFMRDLRDNVEGNDAKIPADEALFKALKVLFGLRPDDAIVALQNFNWSAYPETQFCKEVRGDSKKLLEHTEEYRLAAQHKIFVVAEIERMQSLSAEAVTLFKAGSFPEAAARFEMAVDVASRVLPASDPKLATAVYNLASTLMKIEDADKTRIRALLVICCDLRRTHLGPANDGTIKAEEKLKALVESMAKAVSGDAVASEGGGAFMFHGESKGGSDVSKGLHA